MRRPRPVAALYLALGLFLAALMWLNHDLLSDLPLLP